jgi:hypothetical protein
VQDWIAMSDHDDEPELAGYEPTDGRPLRGRVVVVLGLVGLVLPGILTTITVGSRTAQASCAIWVTYEDPGAHGSVARFQVFGPGFVGWECYTTGAFGGDHHVASLGLIPGAPKLPAGTGIGS